jgi:Xaa-Pro dipeptidase
LLVIDWGAAYNGYFSDLTRTLAVGEIEPEFQRIFEIVRQANATARAVARSGITAGEVDKAARDLITKAGYGKYFTHRVGHGLGMEAHEEPYMFLENEYILEPGNTFTIEPGIYLPGRGGVRIEDDIVITNEGSESLSDFNRTLITVGI